MRRLLLVSILISVSAKGAIDFTPTVTSYVSEGAEYATVSIKDDKRNVSLIAPRLWSCRGDASRLRFLPPNQNYAEAVIQSVPTKGVLSFDEATVKALQQQVLTGLPPGGQAATVVSQQENPVILSQNFSYEFVVSYQDLGQTFLRSVIFVNCPEQQLVFKFSAPKAVFDPLNRSFRQSIYSWQWIEPTTKSASQGQPQNVAAR